LPMDCLCSARRNGIDCCSAGLSRAPDPDHRSDPRGLARHHRRRGAGLQTTWSQPVVVEKPPGGSQTSAPSWWQRAHLTATPGARPDNVFPSTRIWASRLSIRSPTSPRDRGGAHSSFCSSFLRACRVSSLEELIAYAKARPASQLRLSGNGSPQHLGATLFQNAHGTRLNHVPYREQPRPLRCSWCISPRSAADVARAQEGAEGLEEFRRGRKMSGRRRRRRPRCMATSRATSEEIQSSSERCLSRADLIPWNGAHGPPCFSSTLRGSLRR